MSLKLALFGSALLLVFGMPDFAHAKTIPVGVSEFSQPSSVKVAQSDEKKPTDDEEEEELDEDDC